MKGMCHHALPTTLCFEMRSLLDMGLAVSTGLSSQQDLSICLFQYLRLCTHALCLPVRAWVLGSKHGCLCAAGTLCLASHLTSASWHSRTTAVIHVHPRVQAEAVLT